MPEKSRRFGRWYLLLGLLLVASCAHYETATPIAVSTTTVTRISPTETPPASVTALVTATATAVEPTKTPTRLPTSTATPTLAPTPRAEDTLYYKIRSRLQVISNQERSKQKAKDPVRYAKQIDPELANIPPTILFLGCGDDYVASSSHKQRMCANVEAILGDQIKMFKLTHDTGFPKQPGLLVRSDELVLGEGGGFDALRDGWQSATRGPVDVIVIIKDYTTIGQLVDTSFGGKLKVDVPVAFTAGPIWLNGKPTSEHFFPAGINEMTQTELLIYMASTPNAVYSPEIENQVRVQTVLEAMVKEVASQWQGGNYLFLINFLANGAGFTAGQIQNKNIATDPDLVPMTRVVVETAGAEVASAMLTGRKIEISQGNLLARQLYLADPAIAPESSKLPNGSTGLRWGILGSDSFMDKYIQSGGASGFFEIPDWDAICKARTDKTRCGANFNTNTPWSDYWVPVSKRFRDYVLGQ